MKESSRSSTLLDCGYIALLAQVGISNFDCRVYYNRQRVEVTMKVSASRLRKSPIRFKGYISTEDLLQSVAEEQKSMLEELGRTLQIMRDVLALLDATRSSVARFGGSSCPPFKM